MAALCKRRWFQFSLRSLLAVITFLAVVPGGGSIKDQARGKWRRQRLSWFARKPLRSRAFGTHRPSQKPLAYLDRLMLIGRSIGAFIELDGKMASRMYTRFACICVAFFLTASAAAENVDLSTVP